MYQKKNTLHQTLILLFIIITPCLLLGCSNKIPKNIKNLCKDTDIKSYKHEDESVKFKIECYKNKEF